MNTYRHQFAARCPVNNQLIVYDLAITADFMIRVEHIVTACVLFQQGFHEDIAASLYLRFGGQIVLKAHHHGVDIETVLGAPGELPAPIRQQETAA